jgi:hypothetical protein
MTSVAVTTNEAFSAEQRMGYSQADPGVMGSSAESENATCQHAAADGEQQRPKGCTQGYSNNSTSWKVLYAAFHGSWRGYLRVQKAPGSEDVACRADDP